MNIRKFPDLLSLVATLSSLVFAVKKTMNLGLFLLFCGAVTHLIRNPGEIRARPSLLVPALLLVAPFVLTLLSGALQNELRGDKLEESLRYLLAAPCLYYLAAKMTNKHEQLLLHMFGFSWVLILIYGAFFPGIVPDRFDTAWVDVNTLALGSCLSTLMALYMLMTVKESRNRLFWALCLAASCFTLVAAGSRSAWITATICLGLGLWYAPTQRKYRLYFVIGVGLILALTFSMSDTSRQRITDVFEETQKWIEAPLEQNTSSGIRLGLYQGGLTLISAKPWVGYTHEQEHAAVLGKGSPQITIGPYVQRDWLTSGVHNQYIDRGLNHGIAGLMLWLCLYWFPTGAALVSLKRASLRSNKLDLHVFCAVGLIAFGIHGLFHNVGLKYLCSLHALLIVLYFSKTAQIRTENNLDENVYSINKSSKECNN